MSSLLTGMFPHAASGKAQLLQVNKLPDDLRNTIVVWAGLPANDGDGFFDRQLRVALTIQYPNGPLPASEDDRLISTADVLPTVFGLAQTTVPENIHGMDVLRQRQEFLCAEGNLGAPDEWRLVVRGYNKLVVNKKLEPLHLYNLQEDPGEMNNLAKSRVVPRTIDELRALLQVWQRRTNDGRSASGLKKRG
ncbi:MAG: hypothetical protein HYZ37_11135 [Candidatus Solibacter usitatus]|nr:hypothetical protein [Candidatus Solibacter usitatus]